MATGLNIDVATGRGTEVEVPDERPPSPLRAAEDNRAAALERLRFLRSHLREPGHHTVLGEVISDFLTLLGYEDE